MLTVGMVQENCFLARAEGSPDVVVIDPGDEAPRILKALEESGSTCAGILLTHTHFDHIGAVGDVVEATGCAVWCPEGEAHVMRDPNAEPRWRQFGPFRGHDPEHLVTGGERLELAGLEIEVVSTPGHSPAHVTYALREEGVLFSGDVLFQGSIGRVDLPGASMEVLMDSIGRLLDDYDDATTVCPGHMGVTNLGRERQTNPFVLEMLAARGR